MHDKAKLLRKGGDGGAPLSTGVSVNRNFIIIYDLFLYELLMLLNQGKYRGTINTNAYPLY